jgi:hypothetical protein
MNDKSSVPAGWAMPDDQANQVNDELNKKTIPPQDAIQDAFVEIARDIALIEPDPKDWGWWVSYLVAQSGVRLARILQDHSIKSKWSFFIR